jgi:hypothetical protein
MTLTTSNLKGFVITRGKKNGSYFFNEQNKIKIRRKKEQKCFQKMNIKC